MHPGGAWIAGRTLRGTHGELRMLDDLGGCSELERT